MREKITFLKNRSNDHKDYYGVKLLRKGEGIIKPPGIPRRWRASE
jgi:hypothetical protein